MLNQLSQPGSSLAFVNKDSLFLVDFVYYIFYFRAKFMTKSTNHFTLDPHHTLANPMLQRILIASLLFPVFEETICNEHLLDIVSELVRK
jgi:hypothetical protein